MRPSGSSSLTRKLSYDRKSQSPFHKPESFPLRTSLLARTMLQYLYQLSLYPGDTDDLKFQNHHLDIGGSYILQRYGYTHALQRPFKVLNCIASSWSWATSPRRRITSLIAFSRLVVAYLFFRTRIPSFPAWCIGLGLPKTKPASRLYSSKQSCTDMRRVASIIVINLMSYTKLDFAKDNGSRLTLQLKCHLYSQNSGTGGSAIPLKRSERNLLAQSKERSSNMIADSSHHLFSSEEDFPPPFGCDTSSF